MTSIEQLRQWKRDMGYTNQQISDLSGVPLGTVQKIFGGNTKSPRYETLKALEAVLRPQYFYGHAAGKDFQVKEPAGYFASGKNHNSLEDAAGAEKKQGEYTLSDYLQLPDERRVELIDGVFYDMSAPLSIHQLIAGEVYRLLVNYIREHHGKCQPFIAPTDVQLDEDDRTIVEPDVFVVCDRSKIHRERIFGAPDMVIEVLSDSTRKKDMNLKLYKYAQAGVGEYWIVDPKKERILVYVFEDREMVSTTIYGFQDRIPVHTLDGCVIDFSGIYENVSFLLED